MIPSNNEETTTAANTIKEKINKVINIIETISLYIPIFIFLQ